MTEPPLLLCLACACAALGAAACGRSAPAACGVSAGAAPAACSAQFDAVAVVSDYSSSEVGAIAVDGGTSFRAGVDLGADPALADSRDRAFFLARDLGDIFELSPACGDPIAEFNGNVPNHPGTSNPQDLAVDSTGQLWTAEYDTPVLLVLAANGCPTRTLDLSRFDADGNPQASSLRILDGIGSPPTSKAFVALERLNDNDMLLSQQPSMMIRVDVASAAIDAQIELPGRNPFGLMIENNGMLWMASPGNFSSIDEPDAGIERVDPQTFTADLFVHEKDLGGSVAEVAIAGSCGVAIVADASSANATSLVAFDASTGAVTTPASQSTLKTAGYFLQALAWVGTEVLLVGEGDPNQPRASVVHVFNRSPDASADCALTEIRTIPTPLKPIALRSL